MLNPASPLPLKDPTLFRQANCIDGKWVQADSGKTIQVPNPATEEVIGSAPDATVDDMKRAIGAARKAFDEGLAFAKLTGIPTRG